jgi:hypothetical protein
MRILYNALVRTLDTSKPTASVMVVDEGRILAVGGEELFDGFLHAEKQDMAGCTILPGLTDAHFHLQQFTLGLRKIDCETDSKVECLRRVADRAKKTFPGEWVLGHGWNQNDWDGVWPTAVELDEVAPRHPVYLTAKSLHAGWANGLALHKAKIRASTPDLWERVIQRDARGKPTGILLENAMRLVEMAIPQPKPDVLAEDIYAVLPSLWQVGLTGIHDFDKSVCFRALQILNQNGDLHLRVVKSIPREDLDAITLFQLRTGKGDDHLRIGPLKLFADGALGPHTGAMLDSYVDEPQNRGILILNADDIFEYGCRAARCGLSMAVHAIGDFANRQVLDGFARLREYERENDLPSLRHRVEHVQVIHPDDIYRLAALGLIASMQPIHVLSDMVMADRFWGERSALAYAWRTQVQHGAVLAFGSDAPVGSPNPFLGLYAAVTRRRLDGYPGPQGWHPEQRLTLAEAVTGYTYGPAYAASMEERLGKLAAGYLADLIVLEKDPFSCEAEALAELQPVATMVDGEWVWEK